MNLILSNLNLKVRELILILFLMSAALVQSKIHAIAFVPKSSAALEHRNDFTIF